MDSVLSFPLSPTCSISDTRGRIKAVGMPFVRPDDYNTDNKFEWYVFLRTFQVYRFLMDSQ